jgi:hypothetical protein
MADDGYSSGLCDCCSDCGTCLPVALCSVGGCPGACVWADVRAEKWTPCHWCCCVPAIWTRRMIRTENGVNTISYGNDCCLYLCCGPLATCQDCREVKAIKLKRGAQPLTLGVISGRGMCMLPAGPGGVSSGGACGPGALI